MAVISRPKPHEGVRGEDRPGDPVLESVEASTLVGRLVKRLYSASLMTMHAQAGRDLFERIRHPCEGDLVVVQDAFWRDNPDDHYKGVGYLVGIREEQYGDVVERAAVYIQYGPQRADICRWTNCTVLSAESD